MAFGLGGVFVGVTTAATADVPTAQAGFAASLLSASQQLGLAIISAIATAGSHAALVHHAARAVALTHGYRDALLVGSAFVVAAALTATRSANLGEVRGS
jgi:hypothetical protein